MTPKSPTVNASALRKMSVGEVMFATRWATLPDPPVLTTQHRFDADRRWKFDFAHVEARVAVEVDGGMRRGDRGGHTSAAGATNDRERDFAAIMLGWVVFRLTPSMLQGKNGGFVRLNCIAGFIRSRLGAYHVPKSPYESNHNPTPDAAMPGEQAA